MESDFCRVSVAVLAVWRMTHLLAAEDGPFDVFARLRRVLGTSWMGRLMDCFYCLSLWVSAPAAWLAGRTWNERGWLWLALSGGAILLERATTKQEALPPVQYEED